MNPRCLTIALFALAGGTLAFPAAAENGDWYAGSSSGFWGLSPDSQVFEGALGKFGLSAYGGQVEEPLIDKQYTGYRFGELFSVEGAQSQLSLPAFACNHDSLGGDLATPCLGASWSIAGIATLPLNEGLSFYGRLGLQYWQRNGEAGIPRLNNQDLGATYGLGVSYEFRKDWYVHAESERFSDLSQGTGLQGSQGLRLDNAIHSIWLSIRF
jgi:opacity protein-like surface antigen